MKSKPQTEASIMLGIRHALGMRGWRVWRMPPSIYGKKGLPDFCCCKWGLTIWIECKNPKKGKMSDDQKKFAREVDEAGGMVIVARSVDYAVRLCEGLAIGFEDRHLIPQKGMRLISTAQYPQNGAEEKTDVRQGDPDRLAND